jgi:hypothetical protein
MTNFIKLDHRIQWDDLPPRFTHDSIDREIFQPEGRQHCSPAQARRLLDDAEFYLDPDGPDVDVADLKASARHLVPKLRERIRQSDDEG